MKTLILTILVAVVGAACLPAEVAADSFDAAKRCLWSVFLLGIAIRALRRGIKIDGRVFMILVIYMAVRTFVAGANIDTARALCVWFLPLLALYAGIAFTSEEELPVLLARRFFSGCAILGVALATIMLLQYVGWDPLFADTTGSLESTSARMIGTIGYHNQAAETLALLLLATLASGLKPLLKSIATLIMAVAVVLTGCRGAALGLLAGLMVLIVSRKSIWWQSVVRMAGVAIVVLALFFAVPSNRARIADLLLNSNRNTALVSRALMAKGAVDLWREHPLFGAGAWGYASDYQRLLGKSFAVNVDPNYKDPRLRFVEYAQEAHNDALQFLAEFGFVGVVLLAVMIWMVLSNTACDNSDKRTALAVAVFMAVAASFNFTFQTAMNGALAGFIIGMCLSRKREAHCDVWYAPVVVALFVTVVFGWHLWGSTVVGIEKSKTGGVSRLLPGSTLAKAGTELAIRGEALEAMSLLSEAVKRSAEPHISMNLANVYTQVGDWENAYQIYSKLEKSGLCHSQNLLNLSIAAERLGLWEEAAFAAYRHLHYKPSLNEYKRAGALMLKAGHTNIVYKEILPAMKKAKF